MAKKSAKVAPPSIPDGYEVKEGFRHFRSVDKQTGADVWERRPIGWFAVRDGKYAGVQGTFWPHQMHQPFDTPAAAEAFCRKHAEEQSRPVQFRQVCVSAQVPILDGEIDGASVHVEFRLKGEAARTLRRMAAGAGASGLKNGTLPINSTARFVAWFFENLAISESEEIRNDPK